MVIAIRLLTRLLGKELIHFKPILLAEVRDFALVQGHMNLSTFHRFMQGGANLIIDYVDGFILIMID